jgi:hypothetical protein
MHLVAALNETPEIEEALVGFTDYGGGMIFMML